MHLVAAVRSSLSPSSAVLSQSTLPQPLEGSGGRIRCVVPCDDSEEPFGVLSMLALCPAEPGVPGESFSHLDAAARTSRTRANASRGMNPAFAESAASKRCSRQTESIPRSSFCIAPACRGAHTACRIGSRMPSTRAVSDTRRASVWHSSQRRFSLSVFAEMLVLVGHSG